MEREAEPESVQDTEPPEELLQRLVSATITAAILPFPEAQFVRLPGI